MKTPKPYHKLDERKLKVAYQMSKRGQATAIRVANDDIQIIGYLCLCDLKLAFISSQTKEYTVFDFTEAGLERGRVLEHGE